MTDSKYTHILAIVDQSGSMRVIAEDMRGALDEFFKSQAALDGTCLVDYYLFDSTVKKVFEDRPVADTEAELSPQGMTAMLDGIGRGVNELGRKLADKPEDERPGLVQVVVVTDGMENASHEFSAQLIKNMIAEQENTYGWDFVFLGANMDAVTVGKGWGFNPDKSLTYDVHNTGAMSASLAGYTTRSRVSGASSNTFTSSERDAQKS